jgi:hypothetical protein
VHGPTCVVWANLTALPLQRTVKLDDLPPAEGKAAAAIGRANPASVTAARSDGVSEGRLRLQRLLAAELDRLG